MGERERAWEDVEWCIGTWVVGGHGVGVERRGVEEIRRGWAWRGVKWAWRGVEWAWRGMGGVNTEVSPLL